MTAISSAASFGAGLAGTYYLWYKDYNQTSFHFFNDNSEWLQMDKLGHIYSSYQLSRSFTHLSSCDTTLERKELLLGLASSLAAMSVIEILDGFSDGWGFSPGDMIANGVGAAAFLVQEQLLSCQVMSFKFSYHHTPFARYRPQLLGSNSGERVLKDYNGQTIWLSVNPSSARVRIPAWLNIAVGYSATGMTGGRSNPPIAGGDFSRNRQYYLSADISFARIRSRSKVIRTVLFIADAFKLPFPAIGLEDRKITFKPLYF